MTCRVPHGVSRHGPAVKLDCRIPHRAKSVKLRSVCGAATGPDSKFHADAGWKGKSPFQGYPDEEHGEFTKFTIARLTTALFVGHKMVNVFHGTVVVWRDCVSVDETENITLLGWCGAGAL